MQFKDSEASKGQAKTKFVLLGFLISLISDL